MITELSKFAITITTNKLLSLIYCFDEKKQQVDFNIKDFSYEEENFLKLRSTPYIKTTIEKVDKFLIENHVYLKIQTAIQLLLECHDMKNLPKSIQVNMESLFHCITLISRKLEELKTKIEKYANDEEKRSFIVKIFNKRELNCEKELKELTYLMNNDFAVRFTMFKNILTLRPVLT